MQLVNEFIAANKYQLYDEWSPGNTTNKADQKLVNDFVNTCAEELLAAQSDDGTAATRYLEILGRHASQVADLGLDTEDREFTQELLIRLATITGVRDAYLTQEEERVNRYMGDFFGITLQEEQLHYHCMDCGSDFSIFVQRKIPAISAFWLVTRCNACEAVDYLEIPAGCAGASVTGFEWLELLDKREFSREDAIGRANLLSQQQHLKGNNSFVL
jgi:DNA-directed RNA polymerase subunit RPC12/RpoP